MLILLAVFLSVAIVQAYASHNFPSGKTVRIRNGLKAHFGDEWISTTGTDVHVSSWFTNNWLNYTVDVAGSQQVYNGSKPTTVLIDGTPKTEGDGWTYTAGIVTLGSPATSAALYWGSTTQPDVPTIIVPGAAVSALWYMRSDVHTVRGIYGYKLASTQTTLNQSDTRFVSGAYTISYGARVWAVHSDETTTELTSIVPVAVVTRADAGEGLQTAYWNCTGYSQIVDSLMVKIYQRFSGGEWSLRVTFLSQNEWQAKLPAATWTFTYYTYKSGTTTSKLYWGSPNHNTTVSLYYTEPSIYDKMAYSMAGGNFFGFLTLPYVNYIGNMFYGFLLLVMGVTLYQRTESIVPVALMLMVFGGSAGIVTALIPTAGLQLTWIFFVFGLAILLYKLVKARA